MSARRSQARREGKGDTHRRHSAQLDGALPRLRPLLDAAGARAIVEAGLATLTKGAGPALALIRFVRRVGRGAKSCSSARERLVIVVDEDGMALLLATLEAASARVRLRRPSIVAGGGAVGDGVELDVRPPPLVVLPMAPVAGGEEVEDPPDVSGPGTAERSDAE
jgi:hypothetical protein